MNELANLAEELSRQWGLLSLRMRQMLKQDPRWNNTHLVEIVGKINKLQDEYTARLKLMAGR